MGGFEEVKGFIPEALPIQGEKPEGRGGLFAAKIIHKSMQVKCLIYNIFTLS